MFVRLFSVIILVVFCNIFFCNLREAGAVQLSFENLKSFTSSEVQTYPSLSSENVLFTDAPADDGRKLLLIWKYPFNKANPKLNYVVAWSPDGKDWSPREQMIESPCDPDQSMRVKDYWELNDPKMSINNRFEHLGELREYFILEFTDFDFVHNANQDWISIINATRVGLKNKIKEDIRTAFNKYVKDMPISLVDYEPELIRFLDNPSVFTDLDNTPVWGESDLVLMEDIYKLYVNVIDKSIEDVFPKVYGQSFNLEELKSHLPVYKIPYDNPLVSAIDDKYILLLNKQKSFKVSSEPLAPDVKVKYLQLTELHLALGIYSSDAPNEIRWLKTDIVAQPKASIMPITKLNVLIVSFMICGIFLFNILLARKNPNIKIRKINGLEAVDEAIGRATEMGRPILYHTGADPIDYLPTLAAVTILGKVASKVADYECDLIVPTRDPIVLTICQEIVRESYLNAGRIDAFKEENIFFITDDQFAFTAAVNGIMIRERPAANFLMGYYYAEALLLAETGASTGAIQIAGTDAMNQLPFFICTCDYTLIGEELYAASAYLSREPLQMGSLRGQDTIKLIIMSIILLGCLLPTIGLIAVDWFHLPAYQNGWFDILRIIFYPFM